MPFDKHKYHPKWNLISRLVKKRDGQQCTFCGARKGSYLVLPGGGLSPINLVNARDFKRRGLEIVRISLSVCHLDGDSRNNRFHNLRTGCNRCHLKYDRNRHVRSRMYGRDHREQQYDLFA
jgi:hypothetical protein